MSSAKSDPRPGAQYARQFYEKWGFVQKAVCLYAAGVAWKGARIGVVIAGSDKIDWRGELKEESLRDLLPDWFIDGQTTLTFSSQPPARLVTAGAANSFGIVVETAGTSSEAGGLTLLWPACVNFEAIERMSELAKAGGEDALRLLGVLLGFAHSFLHLPGWALEPQNVAEAGAQAVQIDLHWYRLFVARWRDDFARSLCWNLRQLWGGQDPNVYDVFCEWNDEWFPREPLRGWEGVYEAFDHCGLTLINFGKEYTTQLKQFVESGLLPRDILAGWRELDGPSTPA